MRRVLLLYRTLLYWCRNLGPFAISLTMTHYKNCEKIRPCLKIEPEGSKTRFKLRHFKWNSNWQIFKKLWCKWTHRGYPDFSEKSVLLKFDELIFKTTGRDHFNWKYDTGRCQLFSLRLLKSSSFVKISFFFPHPEILPFDANYFDAKLFRVTLPMYFFVFALETIWFLRNQFREIQSRFDHKCFFHVTLKCPGLTIKTKD